MADITKHSNDTINFIRHNVRELPQGKTYSNTSVNTELSKNNYSLIDRGKSAEEINNYRKSVENKLYKFKRKNPVKSVEIVIQKPNDCPDEQEEIFFRECLNYVISQLPMGEESVFMAEVHKDEHKIVNGKDISKPHLHIMFIPTLKDNKHDGFEYKLSSKEITGRNFFKIFHCELQKWIDKKGIKATIQRKDKNGKAFKLTVPQLKEFTDRTGCVIEGSKTIEEIAELCKEYNFTFSDKELQSKIDDFQEIKIQDDNTPALYTVCKNIGVSASKVKQWLIDSGYITVDGNATDQGKDIGIFKAVNSYGQKRLVYDEIAQDFIADHLDEIKMHEYFSSNNNSEGIDKEY